MLPDSLALYGETTIYWHGIIKALAIVGGLLIFWVLGFVQRPRKSDVKDGTWLAAPLTLVLGLFFSRVMYCYFNPELIEGKFIKLFDFTSGGYVLYGAFFAAVVAVFITKLRIKECLVGELFDAMAPAAAFAICVGRLASFFSHEELGWPVEKVELQKLPFAAYDPSDGAWHLAVFNYEAVAAAVAFAVAAVFFVMTYIRKEPRGVGSSALAFLTVFTTTQSLFESMRIDSVFLRTLGFVRFNQAFSAIVLMVIFITLCVKLFKKLGFQVWMPITWAVVVACLVIAFFKEFRLTSGTLGPSYTVMGICLFIIGGITLVLLWLYKFGKDPQPKMLALPEHSEAVTAEVPQSVDSESKVKLFNRRSSQSVQPQPQPPQQPVAQTTSMQGKFRRAEKSANAQQPAAPQQAQQQVQPQQVPPQTQPQVQPQQTQPSRMTPRGQSATKKQ